MSKNKSNRITRKSLGLLRCQKKILEAKTAEVRILNKVVANKQPLLSGPQIAAARISASKQTVNTRKRFLNYARKQRTPSHTGKKQLMKIEAFNAGLIAGQKARIAA